MTPSLDAIEVACRAATPERNVKPLSMRGESLLEIGDQNTSGRCLQMPTGDAQFHALMSPAATLALVADIRRMRKALVHAKYVIGGLPATRAGDHEDMIGALNAIDEALHPPCASEKT